MRAYIMRIIETSKNWLWLRERKAMALSLRNGLNILRQGFAKLDKVTFIIFQ